ncbi:MAG: hypothetical protein JKY56_14210 [Kofleriaceae bacterium]|nr:hypothetical protein [Kofleriaceae bacterium]
MKRDVISLVAKLRSRRKYQEAADLLREAIEDKSITKTIREQLSYELGVILSNQLIDKASACKHWGRHRKRYADGRYQSEVSSAETRLGCTF